MLWRWNSSRVSRVATTVLTIGRVASFRGVMAKLINGILLVLMLVAVGCHSEESAERVSTRRVQLYAEAGATRTAFEYDAESGKYATSWSEGDRMSVLIGTDAYLFDLADAESGEFVCNEVADVASAVDVYGVYPATDYLSVEDCTATIEIGAEEQTQQGEQPAHIAALDPLYGGQESASVDAIRLQMHHTAAVMQFAVKNSTGADVVVESVKVYAPKTIAGKHRIDLKTGEITALGDVSDCVELLVEDGEVANGAQLKAWIAMSPWEIAEGEKLLFIVTTSAGSKYKYVKEFGSAVEFPAGKVMKMTAPIELKPEALNFKVDLTNAESYPDNFPTAKTSYAEMVEWALGGYPFGIYCTEPIACGTSKRMLRFYFNGKNGSTKPTASDYALIYLPYYEGYELNEVEVTVDNDTMVCKIAVANPDNLEVAHSASNSMSDTSFDVEEIVAEMGADVGKQCCVYIHFNGVKNINTSNCNCFITSISVKYLLK